MRRILVYMMLIGSVAPLLAGCGFADSRSPVPDFLRAKEADPPPPESPPDVKQIVRGRLEAIFVSTSNPQQVAVSPPHREVHGAGWIACVRAEVNSATGKPIGLQTYRMTIVGGEIVDRRRVEDDDNCTSETYEPL